MAPKHILVVDDEALVLESVRLTLTHYGFTVQTAASAAEALQLLDRDQFALVVTDRRMPGMSGDHLAMQIKRQWPVMPVILLTGYPPDEKPASVDVVLLKPFSMAELRSAINILTDRAEEPSAGQLS